MEWRGATVILTYAEEEIGLQRKGWECRIKALGSVGRPWNVQCFFQGKFMLQLINNYASSFLHSLLGWSDGYGADTFSLLMPPPPPPLPPRSFLTYSVTASIRAPLWLAATTRIPYPPDGMGYVFTVTTVCDLHIDCRNVPSSIIHKDWPIFVSKYSIRWLQKAQRKPLPRSFKRFF